MEFAKRRYQGQYHITAIRDADPLLPGPDIIEASECRFSSGHKFRVAELVKEFDKRMLKLTPELTTQLLDRFRTPKKAKELLRESSFTIVNETGEEGNDLAEAIATPCFDSYLAFSQQRNNVLRIHGIPSRAINRLEKTLKALTTDFEIVLVINLWTLLSTEASPMGQMNHAAIEAVRCKPLKAKHHYGEARNQ
jgi:hypothetical protein